MKKFLLFTVAVSAAMTMNAQAIQKVSAQSIQVPAIGSVMQKNGLAFNANVKAVEASSKVEKVRTAIATGKATKSAAPAMQSLYGSYVECITSYAGEDISYGEEHSVTLTPYEYTDPETGETAMYINIVGICGGYSDVIGEYSAEDGLIYVPAQICYQHETYGEFDLFCISEGETGYDITEEITYTVFEEDGVRYLQQNEAGLLIYMADYSEQQGSQQNWMVGWDTYCISTNARLYFSEYDSNSKSWTDMQIETFVEDWGDAMSIYNFCDRNAQFSISINDDYTFNSQCPQDIFYYTSQNDWVKMYSYYWNENEEAENELTWTGFIGDNGVYVFGLPLEDGNMDWNYFFPGFAGGDYWFGKIYAAVQLVPYNSEYAESDGIDTVVAPEFAKTIFNLAGQRVNTYTKGINIENGKKVLR